MTDNVGLIGELRVELRLAEMGWRPLRLDSRRAAVNADLIAVQRDRRVAIQVKATGPGHSHSDSMGFGASKAFLQDGTSIFNSKEGAFLADLVVGVNYSATDCRFVVMPVAFAEKLCRAHCRYWRAVPATKRATKRQGERSDAFRVYLCFRKVRSTHARHHSRMQRNLLAFEDRWDLLREPVERLHDARAWPLLK